MRARTACFAAAAVAAALVVPVNALGAGPTFTAATRHMPAAPPVPAATYKTVSQYAMIRMDDGVRLGATLTFPSKDGSAPAPGKFPVVLSMTPYGRDGECGCPSQTFYPSRGIASAVVDVRGTGGSEGNLDGNYFSPREQRDGYELIEWLGTRKWSNGKVGMIGGSYLGITQYLAAEQQPPHLAAIAPDVALSDLYRDAYTYDGVPDLFFDGQYIAVQGGPGLLSGDVPFGGSGGAGTSTDPAAHAQGVQDTAGAKADQAQGRPIMFDYLARPDDGKWYHERSPFYRVDRIKVPVLIVDGWRDGAFVRGDLEMYQRLAQRRGVETRIDVTACTHKGCGAPFDPTHPADGADDLQANEFDFMSHYLLGTPEHSSPPVSFRLQPSGPYLSATRWPPAETDFTRYYLNDGGGLDVRRPQTSTPASYFTNPSAGLSMSLNSYGTIAISPYVPLDQRLEEEQGLTWRTTPVKHAQRLVGPIQLHLMASSTADDTDFVARLSDVAPDGSETVVTEGALRASHRAVDHARSTTGSPYHVDQHLEPLTPGKLTALDVAIIPTAYELAPGHSLQLRVTTDDMPTRLPGTLRFDADNPTQSPIVPLAPAVNTIVQGGAHGSWLLLPLQPARR
jgi:putative CocE/NonD family hydrolase